MNDDSNRSQLHQLKTDLDRVEMDLRFLRVKVGQIEARIAYTERAPATPPPVIVEDKTADSPPVITPESELAPVSEPIILQESLPPPPVAASPEPALAAAPGESFEMRLGTYWFVRIGIVMVLTALVFLGNYAYHHYIGLLGPVGKLFLMYATSAGLLAAGAILPRKQEKLKNYGQVLFAGGLAAVYFTTYAAHHFPNLQVIKSALIDGVLLLGWTSFIVWLADRKKSELLAVFAIGLAYYTGLITNVGSFTLISNLLLAIAAVYFLIRNRWVGLSFLSLSASYGSYFYWRYFTGSSGADDFIGPLSVCGYWIIFTAAIFLSRHEEFIGARRVGFLGINNAAAFALLTLSTFKRHDGHLWELATVSGVILLSLAALARKIFAEDEMIRRAYLTQGIFLLTLGLMLKLTGPTLALVLAVESALLLVFSTQLNSRMLRLASTIVAAISSIWLVFNANPSDAAVWWKICGVFALMLFNAVWSGKHSLAGAAIRPLPAYFSALAVLTWTASVFTLAPAHLIAPILALTTVALTALHKPLRVRELTLLAQIPLLIGQGHLFMTLADKNAEHPWSALTVILISIGMAAGAWNRLRNSEQALRFMPHVYQWAAAFLTLLFVTVHVSQPFQFIALTALFAISMAAAIAGARYTFGPGIFLTAFGSLIWLFSPNASAVQLQNLVAIMLIGAAQFALRRKSENVSIPESAHNLWIALVAGALWIFVSRIVIAHSSGALFYLTASWALLAFALFGIGFALRERVYRWSALAVLAAALCRVMILDVWSLETVYRILSFLALGIVLLALGYIYTRFQEKIARWL